MYTDPAELLPTHQHLLEVDFAQMGEGSTSDRMYWAASMESALRAADHVITSKPSIDLHNAMLLKGKRQKNKEETQDQSLSAATQQGRLSPRGLLSLTKTLVWSNQVLATKQKSK